MSILSLISKVTKLATHLERKKYTLSSRVKSLEDIYNLYQDAYVNITAT